MDQEENSPWQYKPDDGTGGSDAPGPSDAAPETPRKSASSVTWQAPEFIEHEHSLGWYAALVLATALLAGLVYLIAKDYFAAGIIVIVGIIVGVFAGHKPQQAQYEINNSGLHFSGKNYPFSAFKSFTVLHEGPLSSVNLFPLKRFMPPVSLYFNPADEDKITDTLGNYLPYEDRQMDGIDRLSRRLRL